MKKAPRWAHLWLVIPILMAALAPSVVAAHPFPQYEAIQPNIDFWTQIYSTYTTCQAVVHDAENLDIVYGIIELRPHGEPGARKANRQRMKQAKAKYQKILQRLAADPANRSDECRKIAALFGAKNNAAAFSRAARRVRCQIGQKDRFKAGLIRSGAYIEKIQSIFQSHELPVELAYLPHVESSFNVNAYSKFGAAGMWQFTRSTGKRFMKVGYELDERRDPIQATHAAALLLKDNYSKLQSWPLAITAYNHGAAGMARAKQAHGDYPSIVHAYRSRTFKFASRNFYSEFLAAVKIASNPEAYFSDIELDRPQPSRTVVLAAYAPLDELCTHFNVTHDQIKSLNPALRDPVYQGQKYVPRGYALRLPAATETAAANMAEIPPSLYKNKQKPSLFYTVQRGDTAGKIARIHGVRLSELAMANNLNRYATIYPKQTLRIPQNNSKTGAPQLPAMASRATTPPAESIQAEESLPVVPPAENDYPAPVLASVIPVALSSNFKTFAGKTAHDPAELPSIEIVAADVGFLKYTELQGLKTGLIQVEVEETLGHYADWADVRTQKIRRLNKLRFGNTLHLHQKLYIPLDKVSPGAFEEQRYEFHKRLQEDFFANYQISQTEPYRVRRGDSFWTLCRQKFDIPMWLLSNYNPEVDFSDLRTHQKLLIPAVEQKSLAAMESMEDDTPLDELPGR